MDWTLNYPTGTTGPQRRIRRPRRTDLPAVGQRTARPPAGTVPPPPADGSAPATGPEAPGDENGSTPASGTDAVTSAGASSDPDESSEAKQASGMPLATKIALGVLGGLTAVLGGLTAFWLCSVIRPRRRDDRTAEKRRFPMNPNPAIRKKGMVLG